MGGPPKRGGKQWKIKAKFLFNLHYFEDIDTQAQTQITSDSGLDNTQSEQENMDADDSAAPTQVIQGRDRYYTN